MALEDFFTLTEMKAGLTTPDRVEELIILMNKEKDKDVKNVEETSRQWLTVARTIACTDNKECLDRFVQLDGLCFINMWLNDIKNCASDIPGSSVEESLVALLLALEKLNIDDEKVTSSGIGITLRSLIVHNSSVIKDKTMLLLHSWKQHMNTSKVDMDAEQDMCTDNCTKASIKQSKSCSIEISHLDVKNESKCTDTVSNSGILGSMIADEAKDVHNTECGNVVGITATVDHEAVMKGTSDTLCSTNLSIVKDSISITESMGADADPGFTNNGNRSPSNSRKESVLGSLEQNVVVSADVEDKENGITTILDEQLRDDERPLTSRLPENKAGSDVAKAEESATKASQQDPVMVASERIDIPGPVSSSSQEKILDDPTEQLSKSLPQEILSGEEFSSRVIKQSGSDSITQAENVLNRNEPSHVNAVAQEAEINTKAGVLGFDLNQEVLSDDVDPPAVPSQELNKDKVDHYLINQTPMATSVVSASRASAVPGLPAGRLRFEGTHGWKGSAATSAFRRASPRKPVESDNATSSTGPSSSSSKKRQYVHDFDLNMADDGNGDNTPDSVIAVSPSHPSDESCVEIGPMKSKRVELDLNSLGDAPPTASASAYWSKNGVPSSQQNAYRRSPSPTSSSSSVHPSMWDVDLNKKFSIPTFHYDPQQYLQNSTTFNIMDRKPVESGISIMGTRVEDVSRDQTFLQSPPFHHANANLFPPSPPQMQSFMYRPGIPINMVGSPVWHHMMGPAAAQPPYLMNMMAAPAPPAPNGSCSSFDPNMMYMNNDPRQYVMNSDSQGQVGFLEPHSAAISQSQSSSWLTKRKESHSGWDPYHHGSKHHESPGKT